MVSVGASTFGWATVYRLSKTKYHKKSLLSISTLTLTIFEFAEGQCVDYLSINPNNP